MNVLLSAYACNPRHGGEGGNGFHWAWEHAQQGHEVWCLTTEFERADLDSYLAEHAHAPIAQRLHVVYVAVAAWVQFLYRWQFGVYVHYLVWQHMAWRRARQLDRAVDFDLVHHATYGSLQMGSELWRLGKPLIFGPVGGGQQAPKAFRRYMPGWFKTETMRDAIGGLLMTLSPNARQTVRHAALVLAGNRETAALARRLGAQRVELFLDTGLPESFYGRQYVERRPGPELRLLWLARLYPRKALPLVLEALAQVAPAVRFHLTVIGDGPMGPLVPGWIAQYGLTDRVTWRGEVPWPLIQGEMLAHDVFLFGSLRDSFASQFLEAMACGLPIITLNHQGARDFIPDSAAIKVPVTTPEVTSAALARAVEQLAAAPLRRAAMGRAGYEYALTQTWPARAARFRTLLAALPLRLPQPEPLPTRMPAPTPAPDPAMLAAS
ncbi:glycosyltransferase family 4 protein [Hymenobacter jeollabukensis]|uniref:Glycosyltransferase family 4 protein n=1 Tax=Hymenobacter jeollabukensis TaxID=2025313 RepID=A0A5R8WYJ6_9BACT|nr:glycosyltransferase family 4 protein [Hymenobacter jeollabukensis]TLM97103.1 glycosyltransferase family 4 protein [Hymenobacter jeollabukensis]